MPAQTFYKNLSKLGKTFDIINKDDKIDTLIIILNRGMMILHIPKDVLTLIVNTIPFQQQAPIRKANRLFNSLPVTNVDYNVPIASHEIAQFMLSQLGGIDDKFKSCIEHPFFIIYLKKEQSGPHRLYINVTNGTLSYLVHRSAPPIAISDLSSLESILKHHRMIDYPYPDSNWTIIKHIYGLRGSCLKFGINPQEFYLSQFKQYHLRMLITCYGNIFASIKQFSQPFQINVINAINVYLKRENYRQVDHGGPNNYYLDIVHDEHLLTIIDDIRKEFIQNAQLGDLRD